MSVSPLCQRFDFLPASNWRVTWMQRKLGRFETYCAAYWCIAPRIWSCAAGSGVASDGAADWACARGSGRKVRSKVDKKTARRGATLRGVCGTLAVRADGLEMRADTSLDLGYKM